LEEILVERIATSYWRLARLLRAEGGMIAHRQQARETDIASHHELQVLVAAVGGLRANAPNLIAALTAAPGNPKRLRALLAQEDERWRTACDGELHAAAEQRLARLRQQQDHEQAQEVAVE
jgi:hypothetical protein